MEQKVEYPQIAASRLPQHLAIIMDGNQRWARANNLPAISGHRMGARNVCPVAKACADVNIQYLTLFAFSTENWCRPACEVRSLLCLLESMLQTEVENLHEHGIRLRIIGDRSRFSEAIQGLMTAAESLTAGNNRMYMQLAVSYSGRWDITMAMKEIAKAIAKGDIAEQDINEQLVRRFTVLGALPSVDLCIRTGGDQRVSNFLLWDLAYTELYFTPVRWPDFNDKTLADALQFFLNRERRYGGH